MGHPALGILTCGFFGLGIPMALIQLHPKASFLHLTTDGFTMRTLFRNHTVRWVTVNEFAVIWVGSNRVVAWNYIHALRGSGRLAGMSRKMSGYEAALPDTYGMRPQDLADLLNSIRRHYSPPSLST